MKNVLVCTCIIMCLVCLGPVHATSWIKPGFHIPAVPLPDDDPDGPWEGGLDDSMDWAYLSMGCLITGVMGIDSFTALGLSNYIEDEWDLVTWMLITGISLSVDFVLAWMCFAEAFDIREIDNDGC